MIFATGRNQNHFTDQVTDRSQTFSETHLAFCSGGVGHLLRDDLEVDSAQKVHFP